MPSNEIKRQFTLGKMEKDKDDRLVEPGAFRDALNVDVSRSEGDDSGALQVVRGNVAIPNQDINWTLREAECVLPDDPTPEEQEAYDACLTNRDDHLTRSGWGETVGVYDYPQEEKVYFWNTGRPVDPDNPDVEQPLQNAIYEYDQTTRVVSPILIETDTGDYEAGGSATQEFIGELFDTQVWGKVEYQADTNVPNTAFQFNVTPSTDDRDQAILSLTCSSRNIIERDGDDNPVCRTNGDCSNAICTCGTEDCEEVNLLFEASNGNYVCRVGGISSGDVCDCADVGPNSTCDYVELACPGDGGLARTEEDCQTTTSISDDLNYEEKFNMILRYPSTEEWSTSNWGISPDPDTTIKYQVITQADLDNSRCYTGVPNNSPLGMTKYTLNGNGSETQPEEFCDPRCPIFDPYPEYCLATPDLDGLFDTQLTDEAITNNRSRVITMTNVPGVTDGEVINATLVRLRPDNASLTATYDGNNERYDWTAPEDNGRGIVTAENAVIVRGMDALDFQQIDQIFGNVGLASRPVGYTYRVARNGNLSWTPNSDGVFEVNPDANTQTQAILSNINPNDANIPPAGGQGQSLDFDISVDRQQTFTIDNTDISDDIHDPTDPNYIDDNTR